MYYQLLFIVEMNMRYSATTKIDTQVEKIYIITILHDKLYAGCDQRPANQIWRISVMIKLLLVAAEPN